MTTTAVKAPLNGVNVPGLFATMDAVRAQPELAKFVFRANTQWVSGTHNRTFMSGFHGAGSEQQHVEQFAVDADHPQVLVGGDHGPTPAEHLLQALGSCLMSGLANIAAARGIELGSVTARVEGHIDLLGILGLDADVRNGFEGIRVTFHVDGAGTAEQLRSLVEQSRNRSAVFDVITNGTPVQINVAVA